MVSGWRWLEYLRRQLGKLENKYKYNREELESKEFSDGSALEWTNYGARMYEQQIVRWHCTDGKAELYQNIKLMHMQLINQLTQ